MMKWLNGNKTYLGAILWGCLGVAYGQGWVSDDQALTVASILTAWTGVALRSAWAKAGAK